MASKDSPWKARGPYAVGALQTEIDSPDDPLDPKRRLPCEIWYPAAEAANAQNPRFDAPHPLGLPHLANLDLAPRNEPCGLIAFSHGNSGFRQQSTFLTTHLASWGFVVIAPDHLGNTFFEMLEIDDEEERKQIHLRARAQRPRDLVASIRALLDSEALDEGEAEDGERTPRLAHLLPPIDPQRMGALGHSYGGWTSLKTPYLESRIRSVCGLAPVSEPFVGRKAFEPDELPLRSDVKGLVLAAREDTLVDLETSIHPLVDRLGPETRLEIVEGADHFHFCDGLEQLHKMHENAPRAGQKKPTQPLASLQNEASMHGWLTERVARFFCTTLDGATP